MKTRGIENATRRLLGARKLGSASLLAQAEQEAGHALVQARAWLDRAAEGRAGEDLAADANYAAIAAATEELARVIAPAG
ncbi:hypothetical protein EZJ19_01775 [Parasulfuritortus cantonensis]|uniref:Uncharacterized protein n=1 Tax=Parasulfuritortus cantonensis TaxID=2528202 RepID=A0A4R1BMN6_9PROT|nr:hypothetical protein [Parasulfuritortus cantonensis]TCJ18704.1 hypothetical protein EZJ19_01775 [Parasulfuritortus cantonensis]